MDDRVKLSDKQKEILGFLEKKVGCELNESVQEGKLLILDRKWTINVRNYELYNKFADAFDEEKVEKEYESKSFFCDISKKYNNWNILYDL